MNNLGVARMREDKFDVNFSPDPIHFFVRMISGGETLVLHLRPEEKVKVIYEHIQTVTGIPTFEQRLIYQGKLLDCESSLAECMIENDSCLHLVGRMLSTAYPKVLKLMDKFLFMIHKLCNIEKGINWTVVELLLTDFIERMEKKDVHENYVAMHLDIFQSLRVPAALVMLYMSPLGVNKVLAKQWVLTFLISCDSGIPKPFNLQSAPLVLEFCNLLRESAGKLDPLYKTCRRSLGILVNDLRKHDSFNNGIGRIGVTDIFPFVAELANELFEGVETNLSTNKVCDFVAFLMPLKAVIKDMPPFKGGIGVPMKNPLFPCYDLEVKCLSFILYQMLEKMVICLEKVQGMLDMEEIDDDGWDQYLILLKKMVAIAKLYEGGEDMFWTRMESVSVSLRYLIVQYAERGTDYGWIIGHKNLLDFKCRRHLAMLLLPEIDDTDDEDEHHEMLIDRCQLLSDSFNYISNLKPENLISGGFSIKFNNEEATGPGVLREWFSLVCQEIFNPRNGLFVACPNDRARFFLNPASKVNPMHLKYFKFAGWIVALTFIHNIQVGIMLDRTIYLQLVGTDISLEDIKDADPYLYSSCKQILDMDPGIVDQDALALTFAHEIEEFGSRKVIELIADGKNIIVNSRNRVEYVEHLIQYCFRTSVAEQVAEFAKGLSDIVGHVKLSQLVFQTLEFEDLDGMLRGSTTISVEDWKLHTQYDGYTETDSQIYWFWKIVEEMTAEQQKVLLFFWTSLKHLPVDGFVGLDSKFFIYKSNDSMDCLPSSRTCFFRLCFPSYPSMAVMRQRLEIITQDHMGCGFGIW